MRKIPLRKCVVTQERHPKKELTRIVLNNTGELAVDKSGKLNGRGAYIKLSLENIEKLKSKKILDRVLETTVSDEIYQDLIKLYEETNS